MNKKQRRIFRVLGVIIIISILLTFILPVLNLSSTPV